MMDQHIGSNAAFDANLAILFVFERSPGERWI